MPFPCRLRSFSLRTLMVLVTVGCMWLAWERHRAVARAAARFAMKDKAAFIGFHSVYEPQIPSALLWVRRRFGDEPIFQVHLKRDKWTDTDLEEVVSLFPEAKVYRTVAPPHP